MAEYEDAVAEYDDAQATIAAFDEEAQAKHAVATMEVEGDDGEVEEQAIAFADYQAALEVEEPDPSDGSWGLCIPGLGAIIGNALEAADVAPWLQSLVMDGVVAGVGAVIGFIPQMVILFLLLGFLSCAVTCPALRSSWTASSASSACPAKSFIPMLIASGCGVPAVMSTKTIENEGSPHDDHDHHHDSLRCEDADHRLVFGAIASGNSDATWYVAPMFYFMGVIAIIISGIMLKKPSSSPARPRRSSWSFPQYHMPGVKNILLSMWERVKGHIIKARYHHLPVHDRHLVPHELSATRAKASACLTPRRPTTWSTASWRVSVTCWPGSFAPLGFANWQATATAVTGLVAKENVVATVGIITSSATSARQTRSCGTALPRCSGSTAAIVAFCAFNLLCAVLRGDGHHPSAAALG